ncbi:MAG: hypothetical protein QME94_16410 [Anaerolineae bacterium]|nr:hypothetical protein [Anaerolineae bacterium]
MEQQFWSSQGATDRAIRASVEAAMGEVLKSTNGHASQESLECRGKRCLARLLTRDGATVDALMNGVLKNEYFRKCGIGFEGEPEAEGSAGATDKRRVAVLLTCD